MRKEMLSEDQMRRIFAANLKYLRRSGGRKLSQAALSRILLLSRKTIMNYESARAVIPAYDAHQIAQFFGLRMEDLLTKKLYEERKDEN